MLAPKSIILVCSSARPFGCRKLPDCIFVFAAIMPAPRSMIFFCSSAMDVSTVGGGCTMVLDFTGWVSCAPAPDRHTAPSEPGRGICGVSRSRSACFKEMKLGANWS